MVVMIEPKVYVDGLHNLLMTCYDRAIPPHFAIGFARDGSGALLACTTKWHILRHNDPHWKKYSGSGGCHITREQFLSMVFDQPEIFEWLLFHPEWL